MDGQMDFFLVHVSIVFVDMYIHDVCVYCVSACVYSCSQLFLSVFVVQAYVCEDKYGGLQCLCHVISTLLYDSETWTTYAMHPPYPGHILAGQSNQR